MIRHYKHGDWSSLKANIASILALATLLSIAYLIYHPALNGPFVLDDPANIPQTHINVLSLDSVLEVAFDNRSGIFGRPIPVATFALNHYFGDGTAYAFKLTNLVIHIFNTILIFILTRQLINIFTNGRFEKSQALLTTISLITTALWCLHPLQVSTVMYSVQRMTMLMTTFTLISLIIFLTARLSYIDRPIKSLSFMLLAGIFAVLACLSKENGALIVIYVGSLELLIRKWRPPSNHSKHETRISTLVLTTTFATVLSGIAYYTYNINDLVSGYQIRDFSLLERLATQANVVILYLRNIYIPDISNMNLYLDDFPTSHFSSPETIVSLFLLALLLVFSILLRKISVLIPMGIVFFFVSHIMESTFIPLELAFEHRNYTGLAGISLSTTVIATHLFTVSRVSRLKYIITPVMLLMISFQTYSRSLEWSNDLTLNTLAVENNPLSGRAKLSLAISLLDRSKLTKVVEMFETATKNNTKDASTHLHLLQFKAYGGVYSQDDFSEATKLLQERAITNDVVSVLEGMLSNITNQIYTSPNLEKISQLLQIATENQNKKITETNQAVLYVRYSESLSSLGKSTEALKALENASVLNPRNPEVSIIKGELLLKLKQASAAKVAISSIPADIRILPEQRERIDDIIEAANSQIR